MAHIYCSRIRNQIPHIDVFLMRLRDIYITERYIAQTTDKYNAFKIKWARLMPFMSNAPQLNTVYYYERRQK